MNTKVIQINNDLSSEDIIAVYTTNNNVVFSDPSSGDLINLTYDISSEGIYQFQIKITYKRIPDQPSYINIPYNSLKDFKRDFDDYIIKYIKKGYIGSYIKK